MKLYGQPRETKDKRRCEGCEPESKSRSVGEVPGLGGKLGTYQVATTGADSHQNNSFIDRESPDKRIAGKFISQLIKETEYQLAYYEKQAAFTKTRLEELKHLHETINNE